MPDDARERYSNGKYFIKRDRNKAGSFGIYTYRDRQTPRIAGTDTADFEQAKIALDAYVLKDDEAALRERIVALREKSGAIIPKDVRVLRAINAYHLGHAAGTDWEANAVQMIAHVKNGLEKFATQQAMILKEERRRDLDEEEFANLANPLIGQLTFDHQKCVIDTARKAGYTDNTIVHVITIWFTAMRWAKKRFHFPVMPDKISAADWKPHIESDDRSFTLDQMARMFDYANVRGPDGGRRPSREHMWRYLMNAVGSAGRVTAIRTLTWGQYKLRDDNRALDRCHLNPEGRRQTRKRRPTIPMCHTWGCEVRSWERTHKEFVHVWGGEQLATTNFFDTMLKELDIEGSAKMIRSMMRDELFERGVPDNFADVFVGHAEDGSATGRRHYKKRRWKKPEWLQACAAAIEDVFQEIGRRMKTRPPLGFRGAAGANRVLVANHVSMRIGTLRDVTRLPLVTNLLELTVPEWCPVGFVPELPRRRMVIATRTADGWEREYPMVRNALRDESVTAE